MPSVPSAYPRGAEWAIWDLHVHTPDSIVQNYGNSEVAWDRYIQELESLPKEVKVIGINDYWFLDGYKKVLEYKREGRLQNIESFFPVIELRLDRFGGSDSKLSKVNLHVIFDPALKPEVIEEQFIGALKRNFRLYPDRHEVSWNAVITRSSLEDLGRKIIDSAPERERKKYKSPLIEGFNNLSVSYETVMEALENHILSNRFLVGIGKTEWADIQWNDHSIADKRTIINGADLIFTAYEDDRLQDWSSHVEKQKKDRVNHRILDCSDAHWFSDSSDKDRLGNCLTWIKAIPTFAGLKHALDEYARRVYVGPRPPELKRQNEHSDEIIDQVSIRSSDSGCELFNYSVPLNSGLVAVVGNKGQGKSALLDCIALAAGSTHSDYYAFLTRDRFLSKDSAGIASHYSSELTWMSSSPTKKQLGEPRNDGAPTRVEYLPQSYVERICTGRDPVDAAQRFEDEIKNILYTYIPVSERMGTRSFDELQRRLLKPISDEIKRVRDKLALGIEDYLALTKDYSALVKRDLKGEIEAKKQDVNNAEQEYADTKSVVDSRGDENSDNSENEDLRRRVDALTEVLAKHKTLLADKEAELNRCNVVLHDVEALRQRASSLAEETASINSKFRELLGSEEDILVVAFRKDLYVQYAQRVSDNVDTVADVIEWSRAEIASAEEELNQVNAKLRKVDSEYQKNVAKLSEIQDRIDRLRGSSDDEESLEGLQALEKKLNSLPFDIQRCHDSIIECAEEIYNLLSGQLSVARELYEPTQRAVETSSSLIESMVSFQAELWESRSLSGLADKLDRRTNSLLTDLLENDQKHPVVSVWNSVEDYLRQALEEVEHLRNAKKNEIRNPASAVRKNQSFAEFLQSLLGLTWLEVHFSIFGYGKPIRQLSPGQRGLILMLFYLLIDKRTVPLLLDQPEENLDNATIARVLVPALHESAKRRQTIIVTHNANLAVVGDADQVVHCTYDSEKQQFSVSSGSIAQLDVVRCAVDVLEGTKPAFDNRRNKYDSFPSLVEGGK